MTNRDRIAPSPGARAFAMKGIDTMESTPIETVTVNDATGEQGYRLPSGEVVTYGDYVAMLEKLEKLEKLESELSDYRAKVLATEEEADRARRRKTREDAELLEKLIRDGVRPDIDSELFAPFFRRALYMAYRAGNCTEAENFAREAGLEDLSLWHEGRPWVRVGFDMVAPEIELLISRKDVYGGELTGNPCCDDEDYCDCDNRREARDLGDLFDARNWLRSEAGRAQLIERLEMVLTELKDEGTMRNLSAETLSIQELTPSNRNATDWARGR